MAITARDSKPELNKYDLAEQIGHGGMATVYRAVDRRLQRDVAVKLIHPHLRGNEEVAARFVSEARAVAKLKHPNIVEVYDISDESEPERYLVVELIEGPTLRQLLTQTKRLPPEVAVALGLQLAAALRHAHEQGIVHRDVKPENVLVQVPRRTSAPEIRDEERHVTVKLTDFGIAKVLDAHGVTSTGQVLGSPAHMAPEQIEGGGVGPRSDVFCLGVLLYEAMVGSLPFDGQNPAQVLRRVLDGEHEAAVKACPEVGSVYSAILDKALSKSPDDRFASIEELADALEAEMDRVGFSDPQSELDAFMVDPEAYRGSFAERIVEGLAQAGERSRSAGQVGVAAGSFNRALAYRPSDPDLLARVSAVSRGQTLRRVTIVGAAVLAVGALAWGAAAYWPAAAVPVVQRIVPRKAAPAAAKTQPSVVPPIAPAPSAVAAPEPEKPKPRAQKPPRLVAGRDKELPPRKVRVKVDGNAKGGEVHVDGIRLENWLFEPAIELASGKSHTFEFIHFNEGCCTSTKVTQRLMPGDEPLRIVLKVGYRSAQLNVVGPPGMLHCNTLFSGGVQVPGHREVPMDHADVSADCTYKPSDPTASPSVETASLRAGQATTISVP